MIAAKIIRYHKGDALNQLDIWGEDSLIMRVISAANKLGFENKKVELIGHSFNHREGFFEVKLFVKEEVLNKDKE